MLHAYSTQCGHCRYLTEHVQRDLDRRVERLAVGRHDGKPRTSIIISQRETQNAFCDAACWAAAEPALVAEFELLTTYPPFGFVSSCCRCGASVDRTHDYVCLSISKMTFSQDGHSIAACSDDLDWAVLCNGCDQPDGPQSTSVAKDIAVPVPEFS